MDLSGDGIWSLFSPVTSMLCVLLAFYLYKNSTNRKETRYAIELVLLFAMGAAMDFFMSISPDPATALVFGQLVIFIAEVMMGNMLYLCLKQLPSGMTEGLFARRRLMMAIVGIIGFLVAINISDLHYDKWGYSIAPSFGLSLAITVFFLYVLVCISVLVVAGLKSQEKVMRKRVTVLAMALLMPFIYSSVTSTAESVSDLTFARPLMPAFTIMVLLVAFAVWRYRLFIEVPAVSEEKPLLPSSPKVTTQLGRSYLVESRRADMAYDLLLDDLSKGANGLIITRDHPETVKEDKGLSTTPILWLTSSPGKGRIDPTNLSILQHTITEHLRNGHNPVIFLDGLEYLLANNKEDKVLQLVLALRDEIIVSQGKLIVPVDPRTMDPRSLAFFERDLEVVMHGE